MRYKAKGISGQVEKMNRIKFKKIKVTDTKVKILREGKRVNTF